MKYYGTRNNTQLYSLEEAALQGLAPCKGVFMPESLPMVDLQRVEALSKGSYAEVAAYIASLFFGRSVSYDRLRRICREAYCFEVPLHRFDDRISTLELFHGPTLAFKDFGARFMSRMFGELFPEKRIKILTATSGDTGGAVADGFYGMNNVDVYVLYPKGRVSDFQECQMTTQGGNIHPLRVEGSFDDCQAMVKEVFAQSDFCRQHTVTSANSISLLRWIPQSFYFFYLYALWRRREGDRPLRIAVPSGNYGNLTAGLMAHRMGLPIDMFAACSNANDVIPRYLLSGVYDPQESVSTLSNAMDVGMPNNFERLLALCDGSYERVCARVKGFSCTDDQTQETIVEVNKRYGYAIDPHSAIGFRAVETLFPDGGVFLSTAHSVKFASVVEPLVGHPLTAVPQMERYVNFPKRFVEMDKDIESLKRMVSVGL